MAKAISEHKALFFSESLAYSFLSHSPAKSLWKPCSDYCTVWTLL